MKDTNTTFKRCSSVNNRQMGEIILVACPISLPARTCFVFS